MAKKQQNGWDEYKKLILYKLDEQSKKLDVVGSTLADLGKDVSALKVKAAIAGGVAGIVGTGLMTSVLKFFTEK